MSLKLIKPNGKYLGSFLDALEEDEKFSPNTEKVLGKYTPDFFERLEKIEKGIDLPEGYVSCTTLWLVDDKDFIGKISLRHYLTDALLNYGGNIGYEIRYSKRRMGYGTKMLKMGLEYCEDILKMNKVMISCDYDNIGSEKVILKNGGVLAELLEHEGKTIKKHWINITKNIIETDRLTLSEYKESDIEDLGRIFKDPVNMRFFDKPYDDAMMKRLMEWTFSNYRKYGFGFWAVREKLSGKLIGSCGLSMQNIDGEQLPEIGYHFLLDEHGKGYATEATRAVKKYIFKNYAFQSLYSYMTKDNIASEKVAQRNGMEFVKKYTDKNGEELLVYKVDK